MQPNRASLRRAAAKMTAATVRVSHWQPAPPAWKSQHPRDVGAGSRLGKLNGTRLNGITLSRKRLPQQYLHAARRVACSADRTASGAACAPLVRNDRDGTNSRQVRATRRPVWHWPTSARRPRNGCDRRGIAAAWRLPVKQGVGTWGRIKQGSELFFNECINSIAVGMALSGHPPHRSVRAELPHTAPTLDEDEQTARWDRDAGFSVWEANVC